MTRWLSVFLILVLSGCADAFKPVPPYYMNWDSGGGTRLDVKKRILECGGSNPSGISGINADMNDIALTYYCIVNSGYVHLDPFKGGKPDLKNDGWCRNHPELPACQPGAKIPTPSVERRLNSHYCKSKQDYQFCKDNAVNPAACERMDFNNPPPECLP